MPVVIGFDTETVEGPPELVQFYSEDQMNLTAHIWVNGETVTDKALAFLEKHCDGDYVMYCHNLGFDLVSLFRPMFSLLCKRSSGEFAFTYNGWSISGVMVSPSPTFCVLEKDNISIKMLDTGSWFMGKLSAAADLVCPHLPKLAMPEDLGSKYHSPKDTDFIAYAMRDAEVAYHLGKAIDEFHYQWGLEQSWSAANMSQRIFTKHFIDEPIWNPRRDVVADAFKAYHGGKNLVVEGAAPAWHYPVDAWDISSAYPHAMTLLPAFSDRNLYRYNYPFKADLREYPVFGVYNIQGYLKRCHWPVLFTSNTADPKTSFKAIQGKIPPGTWVSGWELNEALRSGELVLNKIKGHWYDADADPVKETPFQRFVTEFYHLKSTADNPIHRTLYKMVLNSISGKFIQKNTVEDADGRTDVKAGPLWHPFIAALITGHTRAVMHQLEHATQAIHTSTDGIWCYSENSPESFPFAPASGLGSIEMEASNCEMALFRNKRYITWTNEETSTPCPFRTDEYRYIKKHACHGSPAGLEQLAEAALFEKREFLTNKPNKPRESLRRGLEVNKFQTKRTRFNDGPLKGQSISRGK